MTLTRREKIEAMLAESPKDTFLRYSLAMEWAKEEQYDRSLELLRELMSDTPPYIAAFHMAGKQLVQLKRVEEARSVLRDGVEHARGQNDHHAASEMAELLTALGILGE